MPDGATTLFCKASRRAAKELCDNEEETEERRIRKSIPKSSFSVPLSCLFACLLFCPHTDAKAVGTVGVAVSLELVAEEETDAEEDTDVDGFDVLI